MYYFTAATSKQITCLTSDSKHMANDLKTFLGYLADVVVR